MLPSAEHLLSSGALLERLPGIYACIAIAMMAAIVLRTVTWGRKAGVRRLPGPKPSSYPFIGNLFNMPDGNNQWEQLRQWSRQWGNITSATALGNTFIFLHTYQKAVDFFDKNGAIFSDRPGLEMLKLMGWEQTPMMMQPSRALRESRRMMYAELGTSALVDKLSVYEEEASRMLAKLLIEDKEHWFEYVEGHVGAVALKITYGYDTKPHHDPVVHAKSRVSESSSNATVPGAFLVEMIPLMRFIPTWFPFARFQRLAEGWRNDYMRLVNLPFDEAERKFNLGMLKDCFISNWLSQDISPSQVNLLKHTAASIHLGATETTSSTLHTFFYMMQANPHIQSAAQDEIENIVGHDRLPNREDRKDLPYVQALCKELLRWHPPFPGGAPHAASESSVQDDGYHIPKDAIMSANVWEMSRDPGTYRNPDVFNPLRFVGPMAEMDPANIVFGFGRRICPGLLLAESTLFVTVATLLSMFEIMPQPNSSPAMLIREPGVISQIRPFKCDVQPRWAKDEMYARLGFL